MIKEMKIHNLYKIKS